MLGSPAEQEVYLIDRAGTLVTYAIDPNGAWAGPTVLGQGYQPGGHVGALEIAGAGVDPVYYIASVDGRGQVHLFLWGANGWGEIPIERLPLPPGVPVALAGSVA